MSDWTCNGKGRSNSSPLFERLCDEVERLIRADANTLINGNAASTARLIMAQLAHKHGLTPINESAPAAWRCRATEEPEWLYGKTKLTRRDHFRKLPGFEEQPLYADPRSQGAGTLSRDNLTTKGE